eukprot:7391741-Prymnesium_polylepis.3
MKSHGAATDGAGWRRNWRKTTYWPAGVGRPTHTRSPAVAAYPRMPPRAASRLNAVNEASQSVQPRLTTR